MKHKRRTLLAATDDLGTDLKIQKGKYVFWVQAGIFLLCCLLIGRARGSIFRFFKSVGGVIGQGTMHIVSKAWGDEPKKDTDGNINIALLGYGGDGHAGGYLTDSIIIASLNARKGTLSMLSIPRDLYIKKAGGDYGKINSIFESAFYRNNKDYSKAASGIMQKLAEITGIPLNYYATVDFKGFETTINSIGGITIEVPEPVYDTTYPGPNNSFVTFSIASGTQKLDGETSLKYARSRHSTSDFSRSMRQQAIIKAVLDKVLSARVLLNPNGIKSLYQEMTQYVHTNLTLNEIIWLLPYANGLEHKSSRQLAGCGASRRQGAQAGCLLFSPPLETFGGASVQIPIGSNVSGSLDNYAVVKSFVKDIVINTDFLAEQPTIRVLNGIQQSGASAKVRLTPLANNTAVELVKAGFTVYDVGNSPSPQTQTTVTTNGKGRAASIKKLSALFPTISVIQGPAVETGPSLTLTIGSDYTDGIHKGNAPLPLYLQY